MDHFAGLRSSIVIDNPSGIVHKTGSILQAGQVRIRRNPIRVFGELQGNHLLTSPGSNQTVEYTAPIHDESGATNVGAIVGVLDLEDVLSNAARGIETATSRANNQGAMVLVVDHSGKIIYDSHRGYKQLHLRSITGFRVDRKRNGG